MHCCKGSGAAHARVSRPGTMTMHEHDGCLEPCSNRMQQNFQDFCNFSQGVCCACDATSDAEVLHLCRLYTQNAVAKLHRKACRRLTFDGSVVLFVTISIRKLCEKYRNPVTSPMRNQLPKTATWIFCNASSIFTSARGRQH